MTKCIAGVAVKLPVVVYGVDDNIFDKLLADLLPPHVYVEIKTKRGENIKRVADAMVGAHAAHATAAAASANANSFFPPEPPSSPDVPTPSAAVPPVSNSVSPILAIEPSVLSRTPCPRPPTQPLT